MYLRYLLLEETSSSRLDILVTKELQKDEDFSFEVSRNDVIDAIKQGAILVNDKKTKPSIPIKSDDSITVDKTFFQKKYEILPNSNLEIPILYEDEHLIAINKPAGIQVHPSDQEKSHTVVNWALHQYPKIATVGEDTTNRPGIVHRLDKDTSGTMILAKTQKDFATLKEFFAERKIQKTYLALVHGILEHTSGEISLPIAKSKNFRKQVAIRDTTRYKGTPREASTMYKLLQQFDTAALIEVYPKTGRMHQIRVHLKAISHPLLGDMLYTPKSFLSSQPAPRHMLHAKNISFSLFGKKYTLSAPYPTDFTQIIKTLKKG